MSLVMYLRITHHRFRSSSDPSLNGHLHYPNDIDKSLNEAVTDKIRKNRSDYNNNPPTAVSFMSAISSSSRRLHSEFIRLLFLQAHRETDRFFTNSGFRSSAHTTKPGTIPLPPHGFHSEPESKSRQHSHQDHLFTHSPLDLD